jgi:hypothetical protein
LFWAGLHLGFFYAALWSQEPELYAGRHEYAAWAGLSIALADTAARLLATVEHRRIWTSLGLVAVSVALFFHVSLVHAAGETWLQRARDVAAVEQEMKQLLPAVDASTTLYARRFVIQPGFLPYAASVWYDAPLLTGGSLRSFTARGQLDRETYLFDYADSRLFIAMPSLQEHETTRLLWQQPVANVTLPTGAADVNGSYELEEVGGPPADRRLALRATPPATRGAWLSLAFRATATAGDTFRTDVWGNACSFRLHVQGEAGAVAPTIIQRAGNSSEWQDLAVDLTPLAGKAITFFLETGETTDEAGCTGYWTWPRITAD